MRAFPQSDNVLELTEHEKAFDGVSCSFSRNRDIRIDPASLSQGS
jgi:hypothetical protein